MNKFVRISVSSLVLAGSLWAGSIYASKVKIDKRVNSAVSFRVVGIDPETGELGAPDKAFYEEVWNSLRSSFAGKVPLTDEDIKPVVLNNGAVAARVPLNRWNFAVAKVDNGKVKVECSDFSNFEK